MKIALTRVEQIILEEIENVLEEGAREREFNLAMQRGEHDNVFKGSKGQKSRGHGVSAKELTRPPETKASKKAKSRKTAKARSKMRGQEIDASFGGRQPLEEIELDEQRGSKPRIRSDWKTLKPNHPDRIAYRSALRNWKKGKPTANVKPVAAPKGPVKEPAYYMRDADSPGGRDYLAKLPKSAKFRRGARNYRGDHHSGFRVDAPDETIGMNRRPVSIDWLKRVEKPLKYDPKKAAPPKKAEYRSDRRWLKYVGAEELSDNMKSYVNTGQKVPDALMDTYKERNPAERAYIANRFDPPKDGSKKPSSIAKAKPPEALGTVPSTPGMLTKGMQYKLREEKSRIRKLIEEVYDEVLAELDLDEKRKKKRKGKMPKKFSVKSGDKSKSGGLTSKGVKRYRKANPGSKLKTAVTKNPKKLKKGGKAAKRRLSFCRRMKGMKKKLTSKKTSRDPDSRINKSLRKWNC